MIIRGMAVGEVRTVRYSESGMERTAAWECSVDVCLALVNFVRLMIQYRAQVMICLTVVMSLFCTVIIAKTIGCAAADCGESHPSAIRRSWRRR
ncbi:MAG: hypothetical protein ACLT76_17920 [Clostridium fessum]